MDFQVFARAQGFIGNEQRSINEALFVTYEPIRLWLKEHTVKAPFRKLLVSFADESSSAPWHGSVSTTAGICEVTEAVAPSQLRQNAKNHRWVIKQINHALMRVAKELSWSSEALEAFLEKLSNTPLPITHFFATLTKANDRTGVKCEPWLAVQPGLSQIGVLISIAGEGARDIVLMSKHGPVYLEDDFPIAKSKLSNTEFLLLDKNGNTLASVPLQQTDSTSMATGGKIS